MLTLGPGRLTGWRVPIFTIPPAPAGTYDVIVGCGASTPEAFRVVAALRYVPDYVATATPTLNAPRVAVPTPPPAP